MKAPIRILSNLALGAVAAIPATGQGLCLEDQQLLVAGGFDVGDLLGRTVAIDGDVALVCADVEARAFHRDGSDWVEEGVFAIPGARSGQLGQVSLSGSTALIGSPFNDALPTDSGRVFVFERDAGGSWSRRAELSAADADAGDLFGCSVEIDGDVAIVGASHDDELGADRGAAYVFERTGGTWSQVQKIGSPAALPYFGRDVALSSSTAVVVGNSGAHVFVEKEGAFVEQANPTADWMYVPSAAAVDGDRLVVVDGQHFDDFALVFERAGTSWDLAGPSIPTTGSTVALEGDLLVVGDRSCDPLFDALVAYRLDGGSWGAGLVLPHSGNLPPVAISGQRVIAGASSLACLGADLAGAFDVAFGAVASAVFRNAGSNPVSYVAQPASVGEVLELTVDLTTTGHEEALVIGFDSPFQLTLGGGQTLLCFDLLGSGGELLNTGFHAGPVADIAVAVPNEPALAGFALSTQAVHAFGVVPFALSNARDLVIGGCP